MEESNPVCSKTVHQARVEVFMRRCGQSVPTLPTLPPADVLRLRARLILEEALETAAALGFSLVDHHGVALSTKAAPLVINGGPCTTIGNLIVRPVTPNLEAIVDGCADLSVVAIGTLSACGVADVDVLAEVDRNNLAKFERGARPDNGGKLIKPVDHPPPDLHGVLRRQGWKGESNDAAVPA